MEMVFCSKPHCFHSQLQRYQQQHIVSPLSSFQYKTLTFTPSTILFAAKKTRVISHLDSRVNGALSSDPDSSFLDRQKALEAAMNDINNSFGKGSVTRLGSLGGALVETFPSGCLSLDLALGGGLPKGRIVEANPTLPQPQIPTIPTLPQPQIPTIPTLPQPQIPTIPTLLQPQIPTIPMMPTIPTLTNMPKICHASRNLLQATPAMPQPQIPTIPALPQPQMPTNPTLPQIPTIPTLPNMPKFSFPPLPSMPTIPNLPATLPNIPFFASPPSKNYIYILVFAVFSFMNNEVCYASRNLLQANPTVPQPQIPTIPTLPQPQLPTNLTLPQPQIPTIPTIYGPESSGKTTLALHAIAEVQKLGGNAMLVDAEHAFDPSYSKALGVDVENLIVCQPDNGEMALEIADRMCRSGAVDLICIDSVSALTPRAEIEIGVYYGNPEVTSGGIALKFFASVRLEIRPIGKIKSVKGDEDVGVKVRVRVQKSKVSRPYKQAEFEIIFGEGASKLGCILDCAEMMDIVLKKGSWYSYRDHRLGQGRDRALQYLRENLPLCDEIEKIVRSAMMEGTGQAVTSYTRHSTPFHEDDDSLEELEEQT
ncbi:AAA+ ATPase domain-containing protein [Cynara cardunculus var. scolymus]|uniref:AAA+ ATPase domain-containing protein n=1 Tax=Cynara cardunculus var. scolymus TaxID=59895 RepID=A0A103YJK4_CYNCS|nr:AAA+ ATPase domain-containing protein [Cynara cardunculus var. scolymus]